MDSVPDKTPALKATNTGNTRRDRRILIALAIFVISFLFLTLRIKNCTEWGDEGFFTNGALRILDGQVIYRDFQHNYPPGRLGLLALSTALFGHQLIVVRLLWCFFHAAAAAVCFILSLRLMTRPFALAVSAMVLLNFTKMNKSVELLLAAGVLLVLFQALERSRSAFGCGFWIGLAACFRQDTAFWGVVLFGAVLILRTFSNLCPPERIASSGSAESPVKNAAAFGLGFLVPLAPIALYLLANGALGDALHDLTVSGFVANKMMSRPFPVPFEGFGIRAIWDGLISDKIVYYIPPVLYAMSLGIALRNLFRPARSVAAIRILLVALLGAALFLQVLPRTDLAHLNKAYVPAHILGVWLAYASYRVVRSAWTEGEGLRRIAALVLLVTAFYAPGAHLVLSVSRPHSISGQIRERNVPQVFELPHGWLAVPRNIDLDPIVNRIARFSGVSDEWMVVFPAGAIFNYLFDIPNPLRYDVLRPGELGGNDQKILAAIKQRIESVRPRFLIETCERSNPEVRKMLRAYARNHGYRAVNTRMFSVYIRP